MINNYKRQIWSILIMLCVALGNLSAQNYPAQSPVALNGKLKISGTQLVNECGNAVQLRGMSTHGPQWFNNCYNEQSLDVLVKDWGITVFRLAMYVRESGYTTNPNQWRGWIDNMVDACGKRGIYCLIDWHVLNPGNPNDDLNSAIEFWSYMSKKHGSKAHVLYEICNEPNGVDWGVVKSYAEKIIPTIRNNNDNTVIIVGTPNWSQDVDLASQNKLSDPNVMYTLHFYAGSHKEWLREKAQKALNNNVALFVTEFGTSHASGDRDYSPEETKTWISWLNQRKISWVCWSYADKNEVSSTLIPGSCNSGNWNNTSECGTLIKGLLTQNPFQFTACNGGGNTGGDQGGDQGGNNNPGGDQGGNTGGNTGGNQGGDQGGDQGGNNNPSGNQGGTTEPETPVTYPTLTQEINHGDIYRIVNKKSGKVMSIDNGASLTQNSRNESDEKQLFRLEERNGNYFIRNVASHEVLTNKYVNNDGTAISQEQESNYDNVSQKWVFAKANEWFTISNQSDYSKSKILSVENASKDDNAKVVLFSSNNQDEQLWGLEYVSTPDNTSVISQTADHWMLFPTIVETSFGIAGPAQEDITVSIFTLTGTRCKTFGAQEEYNIANLASGSYLVVVNNNEGKRLFTTMIVKR